MTDEHGAMAPACCGWPVQKKLKEQSKSDVSTMATTNAPSHQTKASPIKMCPELKAFYDSHGISGEELLGVELTTRFVRLNPRYDKEETLALLQVINTSISFI